MHGMMDRATTGVINMKDLLCPSSTAEAGHLLHGIVTKGRVVPLDRAVPVNEEFLEKARAHGEPRSRMRFASSCYAKGCEHFKAGACEVAAKAAANPSGPGELPPCALREMGCRWWRQEGLAACVACPTIVAIR